MRCLALPHATRVIKRGRAWQSDSGSDLPVR